MTQNKSKKRIIITVCALALVVLTVAAVAVFGFFGNKVSRELTTEETQQIICSELQGLPKPTAVGASKIVDGIEIKVNSVEYGNEKDVIAQCSYSAPNIGGVIREHKQELIDAAYKSYYEGKQNGKMQNATKICISISKQIIAYIDAADRVEGEVTLTLYETAEGKFTLYKSDEAINTVTGGIIDAAAEISAITTANYNGETVDITNSGTIRTGIKDSIAFVNYDKSKPVSGNVIAGWFNDFADEFYRNFIEKDRWLYLLEGLGTTLAITGLAGLMGIVLGFIVAIIRCTNETTGRFKAVDKLCRLYLTVVRGTPVMVQLLIIYFVILLPIGVPKFISAVLCFGLNSGAYVAEIVRGGIMSVDKGQNEAGRSLGFNFSQTMIHFIIPQAFKAVLPALANEFITLLKESSVAFYIGVADLTQGGLKIRSITYSNFMPLIAVALIYLVIVLILTKLVGILERRLRKSDH